MCCCSQVSPCAMVPSCMSSVRLGMTNDSVGRLVKSVGKLVKGWLALVGMMVKLTQGECLRAYPAVDVHSVDPAESKPSEKPVKLCPAAVNSVARFSVEKVCGQLSVVTPWFDPENISR